MYYFYDEEPPVKNKCNTTQLEKIKIIGLFGRYNVELNFNKEVNIYIGENGLGKTTILNCVYYILKKKYDKLAEIDFNVIQIKFRNNKTEFAISIDDINEYNSNRMPRHSLYDDDAINTIIEDIFDRYRYNNQIFFESAYDEELILTVAKKLSHIINMPFSFCRRAVNDYLRHERVSIVNKKGNYKNVEALNRALDNAFNQRIIYLTTYRRIENDFSKYFRNEGSFLDNDMLIRFGMSDVEKSIDNILKLISENSRESFNKMTSVLLKQYSSSPKSEKISLSKDEIDKNMLKIIFDRLGNEIADNDKDAIFSLLDNNEIYSIRYSYLLNLIIKLIENYEKQKIYDEKIKKFVDTCNKYLNDKKFVYDQSELKLYVVLDDFNIDDGKVELSKLSSGEKQIVSLFSKLYLENEKDSILIIDEPELSISMVWQRMLLPDIMRSENCKLLLTVTHSPFIFENEFDDDAKEIRSCINFSMEVEKNDRNGSKK